jgi:hypothetical protein
MNAVVVPTEEGSSSSGGGSGGALPSKVDNPNLVIDTRELTLDIVLEQKKERLIRVTNKGNSSLSLDLFQEGLDEVVLFKKSKIVLSAGESQEIPIVFIAPNKTGIYTGKIFVDGKTVLVSVNVMSKLLLFDSLIVVPDFTRKLVLEIS